MQRAQFLPLEAIGRISRTVALTEQITTKHTSGVDLVTVMASQVHLTAALKEISFARIKEWSRRTVDVRLERQASGFVSERSSQRQQGLCFIG